MLHAVAETPSSSANDVVADVEDVIVFSLQKITSNTSDMSLHKTLLISNRMT